MKTTVWILGDQLSPHHPALQQAAQQTGRDALRVLIIESNNCLTRLPYHPQKRVLLLSAMRHYAENLQSEGYAVDLLQAPGMLSALQTHLSAHQPHKLVTMAASSYRGRLFQERLSKKLAIPVEIVPDSLFLANRINPLPDARLDEPIRQETFYRAMRRTYNLLMNDNGKPEGGQWNFDKDNRKPLPKTLRPPASIHFDPAPLTKKVMHEVQTHYQSPIEVSGFTLAVTHHQAQQAAKDFFDNRLAYFGTYEDALSREHNLLYHSRLSPYLNLGLLDPLDLAQQAEQAYREGTVTINNAEGFIRQVIGWREYMQWQYRRLMPHLIEQNALKADRNLPGFFWTGETDLNCLHHILCRVIKHGYAHHIERLMVLANFCLLADVQPQQVLDWFQSLFIDSYEWVMVPNVIGMGLFADGGQIGTKPYIASANYINKMGDFCKPCRFDHKQRTGENACPFNYLYWGFLIRHEPQLRENQRMARMLYGLKRFDREEQQIIINQADNFLSSIQG